MAKKKAAQKKKQKTQKRKQAPKPAGRKTATKPVSKRSAPSHSKVKTKTKAEARATVEATASVKADLKKAKLSPGAPATEAQPLSQPFQLPVFKQCREPNCELDPAIGGFCRMHYIANWKRIKRKELILKENKLNQYIEELVNKYPEKYIEAIRLDLMQDQEFAKVVSDLELSDAVDEAEEAETIDSLLGHVRKDLDVSGGGGEPEDGEEF